MLNNGQQRETLSQACSLQDHCKETGIDELAGSPEAPQA